MCYINAYCRAHPSGPDNGGSGGGRPLLSTSSTDALYSIGHTIIFIDN